MKTFYFCIGILYGLFSKGLVLSFHQIDEIHCIEFTLRSQIRLSVIMEFPVLFLSAKQYF